MTDSNWATMDLAPKDGKPFLAWYESRVGPPFGTMAWRSGDDKEEGRFHSFTMGTQTKYAIKWMIPKGPI